ncbi:MAG TPA: copper resistance protein CopC [Mycobacteriales bacterium]|nr:copper resistance protein CopC [Mycobacteriales bacterium]
MLAVGGNRWRRWPRRGVFVATACFGFLIVGAVPASAHAVLEHSSPAADAVVRTQPSFVVLTYDEAVVAASDALHVYDDKLQPVKVGTTTHPGGQGDSIETALPGGLANGTYTVTWRVTSADTHIVSGSFEFSIGHRTRVTGAPPTVRQDPATLTASGVIRGLGYVGLIAGPGMLVVALWLWPAGLALRRVRRTVVYAGVGLAGVTLAGFVVQGALAAGVPLVHAFHASVLHLGIDGRFGKAGMERLALLVVIADLFLLTAGHSRRRRYAVSVAALALAATWPDAGHASIGSLVPLAFIADLVHVAAMATWLGGLLLLVSALLATSDEDAPAVVVRFSRWALTAVAMIVGTGLFAAWRNVRHWAALVATRYGVLLLLKTGVVLVVIAIAVISRRLAVQRVGGRSLASSTLRRAVAAEAGAAVLVLGITAALTGTAQAYEVYAPAFTQAATDAGVVVTVHLDRTRVGSTRLVVSTQRSSGGVQRILTISGSLTEVEPPVGPLPITFKAVAPGREVATVSFPDQGSWQVQLNVQTSPINEVAVTATVPIK